MGYNRATFYGRFANDPELELLGDDRIPRVKFAIAVQRDYKNKQTDDYDADFFNCEAWRGKADFIKRNFGKGQSALVSGRMQVNIYTDNDGNKRQYVFLNVSDIYFAGPKTGAAETSQPSQGASDQEPDNYEPTFQELSDEGDLPF